MLRCHHAPVDAGLAASRGKRTGPFRREIRVDPQLIRVSDCNDNPPPTSRYRRLDCTLEMQRPVPAVLA
jgi:hypothetical protein